MNHTTRARIVLGFASLTAWVLAAAGAHAQSSTLATVRHRQQAQKEVREMAEALVEKVFGSQLQQLRENGMVQHPLYIEIQGMQQQLNKMLEKDKEMSQVSDLLAKLESAPAEERPKLLMEAREKGRQIAIRLLIQRQRLMQRLKIAEIVSEAQQLLEYQKRVHRATELLPGLPADRRLDANFRVLEDQRDITAACTHFRQSLTAMSRWEKPLGDEATEALKVLQNRHVDDALAAAEKQLRTNATSDATYSQRSVIKALEALLSVLNPQAGAGDFSDILKKIRELIEREERLLAETEKATLDADTGERLANVQAEIRKDIITLVGLVEVSPLRSSLEGAEKAAHEATDRLFTQEKAEAIAKEKEVLKFLKQAGQEAEAAAKAERPKPEPLDPMGKEQTERMTKVAKALDKVKSAQEKQAKAKSKRPPPSNDGEKDKSKSQKRRPSSKPIEEEGSGGKKKGAKDGPGAGAGTGKGKGQAPPSDEAGPGGDEGGPGMGQNEQREVGEDTREAEKLLDDMPEVGDLLRDAGTSSDEALNAINSGKDPTAPQDRTAGLLAQASDLLSGALGMTPEGDASQTSEGEGQGEGEGKGEGEGQGQGQGEGEGQGEGQGVGKAGAGGGGGTSRGASGKANRKPAPRPLQVKDGPTHLDGPMGTSRTDRRLKDQAGKDDIWVSKLPPEYREAARSNSQRRPPRGYDERMQRYFDSLD